MAKMLYKNDLMVMLEYQISQEMYPDIVGILGCWVSLAQEFFE